MKLLHVSDLHLGKRLNEYSLIEDQQYILNEIIRVAEDEQAAGIIIAGDVYDKTQPSTEAIKLFDDFIVELAERKIKVYAISGNHDSAGRLAYGNRLIQAGGIHISSVFAGQAEKIEEAEADIYLLPFVKPAHVRQYYDDVEGGDYTGAIGRVINQLELDKNKVNILVAHQFVTGGEISDSEENVGGLDNVEAAVFEGFDYVALGHLHRPQKAGKNGRYSGSPLMYSFSEINDRKSLCLLEIQDGELDVKQVELKPLRQMYHVKGSFDEVMQEGMAHKARYAENYVRVTLTDDDMIADAMQRLRALYKKIMVLDYDNNRTSNLEAVAEGASIQRSPMEIFEEFYEKMTGGEMTEEQKDFCAGLIEKLEEDK